MTSTFLNIFLLRKRINSCIFRNWFTLQIKEILQWIKLNNIQLFSGNRANLFTAAMFNTYSPPPGFCFDVLCTDEPMIDDPDSPDHNIDRRVCNIITSKYGSYQL